MKKRVNNDDVVVPPKKRCLLIQNSVDICKLALTNHKNQRIYIEETNIDLKILNNQIVKNEGNYIFELKKQVQEYRINQKPIAASFKCLNINNKQNQNINEPSKYVDLISDGDTNRMALLWMKSWDKVVFNKPLLNIQRMQINESLLKFFEIENEKFPKYKVMVIYGPCGVGKTTMANIISRHCGYIPKDIDPDIEKNTNTISNLIKLHCSNQPTIFSTKRQCLILDEFDTYPTKCVTHLGNLINFNVKSKHQILRPIIIICKDIYDTKFKHIRNFVIKIKLEFPSKREVISRISKNCSVLNMKMNRNTIEKIVDFSGCNIRLCMNFILMHANDKDENDCVNVKELNKNDNNCIENLDIYKYIQTIFTKQNKKSSTIYNKILTSYGQSNVSGISLNQTLSQCQKYNFNYINAYLYENYINCIFLKLENLQRVIKCLQYSDLLDKFIKINQNYSTSNLRFLTVAIIRMYASNQFGKVIFPNNEISFKRNMANNVKTVKALLSQNMTLYSNTSYSDAIINVVPYLTIIISPNIKIGSYNILSNQERNTLDRLVSIMHKYNLEYTLECHSMLLRPNLNLLSVPTIKYNEEEKNYINSNIKTKKIYEIKPIIKEITQEQIKKITKISSWNDTTAKPHKKKNSLWSDVWYKYHEGVSNSVKKDLYINKLL